MPLNHREKKKSKLDESYQYMLVACDHFAHVENTTYVAETVIARLPVSSIPIVALPTDSSTGYVEDSNLMAASEKGKKSVRRKFTTLKNTLHYFELVRKLIKVIAFRN
jgi:hypothetical protein